MATVIYGGSRELNFLLSGEPHQGTLNYLRQQTERVAQYVQNTGSEWAQRAVDTFNYFSSDDALRHARAALSKVGSYFQSDVIKELTTLSDFQNATPLMQRFIMSEPTIRRMYHKGMCEGYREAGYVDPFPKRIGEDDYNWRRVHDGRIEMLPVSEEDPEGSWCVTTYFEELHEGDKDLTLLEQDAIISSWNNLKYHLANGLDDPVSSTGGML